MKLITRDTDYAIRALCCIAKNRAKIINVSELIDTLGIPRAFLRKILQRLNRNRILKSYKGKGGGFLLSKPAEKIYLTDVIEVFQGPLEINECLFRKKKCPSVKNCVLKKKIDALQRFIISELRSITIASLLKKG